MRRVCSPKNFSKLTQDQGSPRIHYTIKTTSPSTRIQAAQLSYNISPRNNTLKWNQTIKRNRTVKLS